MLRTWTPHLPPPESFFQEHPELPRVVASLLYNRQITTPEAIDEFLNPDYTSDIHDPFLFQHMTKAVERLFSAIEKQETITIHGDYDADGVCASVILQNTLTALGATNVNSYLPHRETDGYGLNMKTVQYLKDNGTNVIITCDCGISNTKEVILANELGLDVIITDHHSIPAVLPPALATIHPKVEGEPYPDKNLSGGGVAFKLAQALLKTHAQKNEILPSGEAHANFEKWLLDMVAISTVADMVPLIGESRTLTKYGLIVLNKTKRLGLQKLLAEAGLMPAPGDKKKEITAGTIGFVIAPRINAAGRLDHANVAYKLLTANTVEEAERLATDLGTNNSTRREITDECVAEACRQVEAGQQNSPVLFVYHETWLAGIVGLIASRIKEKYQKPVIAMAKKQDELMGSGRSVAGFDMIGALQEIPECFTKFGGHPMACGFTLAKQDPAEFQQKLTAKFQEKTAGQDMSPTLSIDAEISLEEITWELYDVLERFAPFGMKNDKPKYLTRDVQVVKVDRMGSDQQHIRFQLKQADGLTIKKAVMWNCEENFVAGDQIDLVFEVDVNEWNGNRELQLLVVDVRKVVSIK